ncbi:MAG: FtsX-like permease family protein [Lachnospiraceae bacterium]|nr:FtsX-like permease family protein [Lachnospiraceae bacterium]
MSFIKRAFLYVVRKWQQSIIVFLILFAVCTSALVGLAILKASDTAAANLRRQFGGTFSLGIDMSNPANMHSAGSTDRYTGSYYSGDTIDNEVIDEVLKTPGIADYSANIEVVANLKSDDGQYYNLAENKQNYYSSAQAHIAPIQGWTSLQQCSYFANGILEVTQGEMFSGGASGQAVISRELAELNGLTVGSRITLEINRDVTGIDFPAEKQECVFEIAGIFDILMEQQIDQYTGQRQMLQNWVFVNSRTLLPYLNELLESIGMEPMGYEKVTFSIEDPAEMDTIIKGIQSNRAINWNCFKIEFDNASYQSAEDALNGMNSSVRLMIVIIVLAGIAVLALLLSIWAKFRVRETGVMLALGESRGKILAQRITEIALVAVLTFGLSYPASGMAANNIGNMLLTQANEQIIPESPSNTIQTGMPITSDDFDLSPVFAAPKVEELTVTVTSDIFMAVYGLGLMIVLLSVCAASVPAMRMKPNEILSKMD